VGCDKILSGLAGNTSHSESFSELQRLLLFFLRSRILCVSGCAATSDEDNPPAALFNVGVSFLNAQRFQKSELFQFPPALA